MDYMNKNKFWTLRYALINMSYFAGFCCIHAYASVYLLSKGFSNSAIGITLALASIVSVMVQPVVAGYIDGAGRATNRNVSAVSLVVMGVLGVGMIFANGKVAVFITFALAYMFQMLIQPLIIALSFEYQAKGCKLNFGLARGLGSCGFASLSPFLGSWIANWGADIMPYVFIVTLIVCFLLVYTFWLPEKKNDSKGTASGSMDAGAVANATVDTANETVAAVNATEQGVSHNNFFDFVKHYPKFMLCNLAILCFFFSHNALNDYLIQIITPLGGNEAIMGYMVAATAYVELPTMAVFVFLARKIDCGRLLKFSGVMFMVKTLIMFMANSIGMAMISQFCQIGAYALFTPAIAYYASKVMEENDKVKGQAYTNAALTLGGVFSGLACGALLDLAGPKLMLLVATIVAACGAVIGLLSIEDVGKEV